MRDTPVISSQTERTSVTTAYLAWLSLAVHAPAIALGGNRFGLILPTALIIIMLFVLRAVEFRPPTYSSWLWLGVLVWGAIQIAFELTPDTGEAARILARCALYGMVYLIAADIGAATGKASTMIKGTALWVALMSIYGLTAWSTGYNPVLAELEAYPAPLEATFVNKNAFALYAVFGVLASLSIWASQSAGFRDLVHGGWIWLAAAVVSGTALVLTGSRGGIGAGVIGLVIFVSLLKGARWPIGLSLVAFLISLVTGESFLREAPVFEDTRFAVHQQILAETARAPLTGHGLGAFQDVFRAPFGANWRWGDWDHAHQQYLETAYEIGWPAAIALFASILLSAPKPRHGDPVTAMAHAALGAAAFHAFVDFSLTIPSVSMTLALLLGLSRGHQRRLL